MRSGLVVFAAVLCFFFTSTGSAADPGFREVAIDPQSTFSASAVVDVNGDGRPDIISGGWWYEAPNWKKHFLRDVEEIRGRFDDYSSLLMDVNHDGHVDLISCNYRSETLYWVENPGSPVVTDQPWKRHVIDKPGAMETGRLFDVDGDGREDVVPNGIRFASWWDVKPGNPPVWTRHSLPDELAGHGIGFGDINGDGRKDFVSSRGWAEAPEDRRGGRWVFHAEFDLWKDASIPILVEDVDGDGDGDLVWGRGHRAGVYWMEQVQDGDRKRSWIRHAIDTSWSQAHSLLWADLNGDGKPELITGSRCFGHDGKDIGEHDPLSIFAYEFLTESKTWRRIRLSQRHNAGFDLDPKAADIDLDGDLDLICPGRSGLYVLENLRINPAGAAADAPRKALDAGSYRHSEIMTVRHEDGSLKPVTSAGEMGLRRRDILDGMSLAMGPLPDSERRVPLDVQIVAEETGDGYVRRRINFVPESGDRVPAWLLIPAQAADGREDVPGPAMLCLHQTTGIGKGEPAGLGGLENLHYAHELAKRGFVCLVPDYPSFGDYPYDFRTQGKHYESGSMKAIWNNIRAIDVLESMPEVDPDRIGCIGHSLGGHNTLFTAAFDLRIKAAVTSCGFTAFHDYYKGALAGWTSDCYMPRIRDVYGNDPNRVPFDFYEVLGAIAPRSIFVNAPISDSNFEVSGVRKVVAEAEKAQQIYGAQRGEIVSRYPECGHDFPDDVREESYRWLEERLKPKQSAARQPADKQSAGKEFQMQLRSRKKKEGTDAFERVLVSETWSAAETAVIVCDVWDKHHCLNAVRRMEEFLPRLNEVLTTARRQGATIIHAPSDCMPAYADHPARKRAAELPIALTKPKDIEFWCSKIPAEEQAAYPIDQSDGGEDDDPVEHARWAEELKALGRNPGMPWKSQHEQVEIDEAKDYISDRGEEVWSILESRGIRNVILVGVHTNMCVLGRPFGLRQMARNGKNVVLMRDLTDCMYNPERWPYVDHFTGNDLIVSHVERFVCSTVTSDQILGGQPFVSRYDTRTVRDVEALESRQPVRSEDFSKHWTTAEIGAPWSKATSGALEQYAGPAWYRCTVRIPDTWLGEAGLRLFVPGTDHCQIWMNGQRLESSSRMSAFVVPEKSVVPNDVNLLVIRVDHSRPTDTLSVAPSLEGTSKQLKLDGRWQFRLGDDDSWSNIPLPAKFGLGSDVLFEAQ